MIKITAGKASAFNSPIIGQLFSDSTRKFPVKVAFQLSDLIQQIQAKLKNYNEQLKHIIEEHGGTISSSGLVTYPEGTDTKEIQSEIDKLNSAEVELTGSQLEMDDSWPNLSLAEITVLMPLIKQNGTK